jgi:hypothetical protein
MQPHMASEVANAHSGLGNPIYLLETQNVPTIARRSDRGARFQRRRSRYSADFIGERERDHPVKRGV